MQMITNVVTGETHCSVCPYRNEDDCDTKLTQEAIDYLLILRDIQDRIDPNNFNWLIDKLRTRQLLEEH